MPITIDIPKTTGDKAFDAAYGRLTEIQDRFSPFKPKSELSRFRNGAIKRSELSTEMKRVIKACAAAKKMTGGYFSAYFDGEFNPTGYVKGWAIAEAGKQIEKCGFRTYCIGAGGDILARSDGKKIWKIGIQNPRDKSKILDVLSISNGAVATSGNYERGAHIINPKTGKPAEDLLSTTVVGPDIIKADILATAAFAMGQKAVKFMEKQTGYEAIIIDKHKY